jgi:HD-like signal output (HDOD) protein
MVEMQAVRDKLLRVFEEMKFDADGVPQTDMRAVELRVIGADHTSFGAALCNAWKFPKNFAQVAGHHHDPMQLPAGSRMLTSIVCVADRLSAQLQYGFRGDLVTIEITPAVCDELTMSRAQLQAIQASLPEIFAEVQSTFG